VSTFTTGTIDSRGVKLATRDYGGPGPALVLMHGAGMEQGSLEPVAERLQEHFRVITFDFRGHGGTDRVPWTFASAVQDVSAVAAAYGLGVPAVGGHSLGGMVAAAYGAQHPTCPAVVNIDGHGRGRVDQYVGCDEAEVRALWAHQQRRLDRLTRGVAAIAVRSLLVVLGKPPATTGAIARQCLREVEEQDLFALYRALDCPLLVFNAVAPEQHPAKQVLAGKALPFVAAYRQGLARDLAALAADDERVEVATVDATHILIRTHPDLVAQRIAAFLQPQAAVD